MDTPVTQNTPVTRQKWMLPILGVLAMAASYSVFFLQRNTVFRLGREDGFFEDMTAICFFAASLIFAVLFWRSRGNGNDFFIYHPRRNVWFILLALLFFFGGGEEISWGQRIFGWKTPETFEKQNIQRETNIHNLKMFNRNDENWKGKEGAAEFLSAERLFSLFWFGFCVVTPLLWLTVKPFARLMERVNMPRIPLALGALFLVNYGVAEMIKPHALRIDLQWPLMEIKECLFSVLFFLIAIYFGTRQSQPAQAPAAATLPASSPTLPMSPPSAADDDDELEAATA
jgi:hypothetical protein